MVVEILYGLSRTWTRTVQGQLLARLTGSERGTPSGDVLLSGEQFFQ